MRHDETVCFKVRDHTHVAIRLPRLEKELQTFVMFSCPAGWTLCHYTCHAHQNKLTNLCVRLCVFLCVFQGVIGDLRVLKDPRAAERHCEEDEDDSDGVRL